MVPGCERKPDRDEAFGIVHEGATHVAIFLRGWMRGGGYRLMIVLSCLVGHWMFGCRVFGTVEDQMLLKNCKDGDCHNYVMILVHI